MTNKETKIKYKHNEQLHNLAAPKEMVPIIINLFNPKSVVDVGCGLGNFLYCFKKAGVEKVLGIDGEWVNKKKLSKYLQEDEFLERDLEKRFALKIKYDMVLCMEVAEHLSLGRAATFIQDLVQLGDVILFSAAIPFQGGQNHLNEQWLPYWEKLFKDNDFILYDVMRPALWENQSIPWWYKQNAVVFAHKDVQISQPSLPKSLRNLVHPELLIAKTEKYNRLEVKIKAFKKGKGSSYLYFKLFIKSLFN